MIIQHLITVRGRHYVLLLCLELVKSSVIQFQSVGHYLSGRRREPLTESNIYNNKL